MARKPPKKTDEQFYAEAALEAPLPPTAWTRQNDMVAAIKDAIGEAAFAAAWAAGQAMTTDHAAAEAAVDLEWTVAQS